MPFSFRRKQSKEEKTKLQHQWHIARHGPDNVIDFSDCGLRDIPEGTYATCRVLLKQALLLHSNHLESLKESGSYEDFEKLECLQVLDVHNNCVHGIPQGIGNLYNLQILNFEQNRIHDIPPSIAHLSSLQTLNLRSNRLKRLPDEISELSCLRTLDISENRIKRLPDSFWKCRCLETLVLDALDMEYPPPDTCLQGTNSVMKFLCQKAEVDYVPPSKAILSILTIPTQAKPRGGSLRSINQEPPDFAETVREYQKLKDEKQRESIELERRVLESQATHAELVANAASNRAKLMKLIAQEQDSLDKKMQDVQHSKELEKQRLLEALRHLEEHTEELTQQLLSFNEQARRTEKLIEEEEKKRLMKEDWLRVRREEIEKLRKQEVQDAMEQMLASYYGLEQLRQMTETHRNDVLGRTIAEYVDQADRVQHSLAAKDAEVQRLVEHLVRDEKFQKDALEALMFQRDMRTNRINSQIDLIQRELSKLSCVELKKKELRLSDQVKFIEEQRQELTKLLIQLLQEQSHRQKEIRAQLLQMEQHKLDEQNDYWLVQFQRLIDNKPRSLIDAENQLEPEVVKLLYQTGAEDYIPSFARHHITLDILPTITEEDLQKIGIYSLGIRRLIMAKIQDMPLPEKEVDGPGTSVVENGAAASPRLKPSAPSIDYDAIPARFEVECVVCMDEQSAVVFIPCGHVCCCSVCSQDLKECPMCRADVSEKVDLRGIQLSASSQDSS